SECDIGRARRASHAELGERLLCCEGNPELLFTENETNNKRLFGSPNRTPYVKDGINNYIVHGQLDAVNFEKTGTKAAVHYQLTVEPGQSQSIRLRLSDEVTAVTPIAKQTAAFGLNFDIALHARQREADEFYAAVIPGSLSTDAANVMRQAIASMLWTKQFYYYDVNSWLDEHGIGPFKAERRCAA